MRFLGHVGAGLAIAACLAAPTAYTLATVATLLFVPSVFWSLMADIFRPERHLDGKPVPLDPGEHAR